MFQIFRQKIFIVKWSSCNSFRYIDVTFSFWKMPQVKLCNFHALYLGIVYFFFLPQNTMFLLGFLGSFQGIPAWGPEVLEDDEDSCLSAGNVTGTLGPRSWEVIDEKVYMDVKWVYEVNEVWTYYHLVHYIYTYIYIHISYPMLSYYPTLYHFLTLHPHWHQSISRYRWLKSKHPGVKLVKLVGFRSSRNGFHLMASAPHRISLHWSFPATWEFQCFGGMLWTLHG